LTFLAGETAKTVSVTVIGDQLSESDEAFFLNLSNPTGALIADSQGRATLIKDDALPTVTIADAWIVEGQSGTKNITFTLQLSTASGQYVSVSYATADGTATLAGNDYQARSGTAGFSVGMTTQTVNVPVVGDTTVEGEEFFYLNLTGVSNAILADDQAVGAIYDDEPLPVVYIGDKSAVEGNSGTSTVTYTVSLSAASTLTITVQLATSNGSATAGSDYVAKTELITFAPGQTSKLVSVTVLGDAIAEASETYFVTLSNPTNAVPGKAQATGTILNDDTSLRVNDVTVAEGNDGTATAVFTVSLTGPPTASPVWVNYATANSTAAANSDYVSTSGTLLFEPGQTNAAVTVLVLGDVTNENDEAFYLNLSSAVNATIADSRGVATIVDASDPISSLAVADVTIVEGNSGTRNLNFVVTLSAASGKTVTVNYATANGSAVAGADYQAKSGTLSFSAGSVSQTVSVPLTVDTVAEIDETFFLNLFSASNATIADNQAVGTIQDDDSLVVDDISVIEGDAGAMIAQFTIRLLAPRAEPVAVNYATSNGSSSAGADYLSAAGTLTLAPGQGAQTVAVVVIGDRLNEAVETFYLNLSNASGALIADSQGLATIGNDDPLPSISATDVIVAEGNAGTKNLTFTLRLSDPSGQAVSVLYATADGTATVAGFDYVAKSGSATINSGSVSTAVSVTVNGDMAIEGGEYFYFSLSNPTNATLMTPQVLGTIFDDDSFGFGSSFSGGGSSGPSGSSPVSIVPGARWIDLIGGSSTLRRRWFTSIDASRFGGTAAPAIDGGVKQPAEPHRAEYTHPDYQLLLEWPDQRIASSGGLSSYEDISGLMLHRTRQSAEAINLLESLETKAEEP
jgi:chitinase